MGDGTGPETLCFKGRGTEGFDTGVIMGSIKDIGGETGPETLCFNVRGIEGCDTGVIMGCMMDRR